MSAVPSIGIKSGRAPKAEVLSVIDRMALDPTIPTERLDMMIRRDAEVRQDAQRETETAARLAYDRSMTVMQPLLPTIAENGKVVDHEGKVKHTFAEWEDIAEMCRPVLAAHGFNLTFRAAHASGRVLVKAICAHDDGWREETESLQFIDTSDGKNSNQAVKSAESYGKRASAILLLNIISRGDDDDGQNSVGKDAEPHITPEHIQSIRDTLTTYGRVEKLLIQVLKVKSLEDLPVSRFDEAITLIHQFGRAPILRPQEPK